MFWAQWPGGHEILIFVSGKYDRERISKPWTILPPRISQNADYKGYGVSWRPQFPVMKLFRGSISIPPKNIYGGQCAIFRPKIEENPTRKGGHQWNITRCNTPLDCIVLNRHLSTLCSFCESECCTIPAAVSILWFEEKNNCRRSWRGIKALNLISTALKRCRSQYCRWYY
jgi:hypothetical protein